jgi:hypothetical protein
VSGESDRFHYADHPIPFELRSDGTVRTAIMVAVAMGALFALLCLAMAAYWAVISTPDRLTPWMFPAAGGVLLLSGCLWLLRAERAASIRDLHISSGSLGFGARSIAWSSLSTPEIEEIDLEDGSTEYYVTFCIVGDRVFGTWPRLDPRRYRASTGVPSRDAAMALCHCLGEAQRRGKANELSLPGARLPVPLVLRTS